MANDPAVSTKSTPAAGTLEAMLRGTTRVQDLGRATSGGIAQLPVDEFTPNPWQYRTDDRDWVEELARSIDAQGQLEAITYRVAPTGQKEILGGHSRWEAFKLLRAAEGDTILGRQRTASERARFDNILANEKLNVTDEEMQRFVVVDNLVRKDPPLVDTARAIAQYQEARNLTTAQVAEAFSLDARRAQRLLYLHRAPEVVKRGVSSGVMVQLYDDQGQPLTTAGGREKREHRHLDLIAALELAALHSFLTKHAPRRADKRVEDLVRESLEQGWSFRRVQDACRKERDRIKAAAETDSADAASVGSEAGEGGALPPAAKVAPSPFRADDKQVVIFRSRLAVASDDDKAALRALLSELLSSLA